MPKMITVVRYEAQVHDKAHEDLMRNPHFITAHLEVLNAMAKLEAAKVGDPAPHITGEIVSVTHE